MTMTLASVAAGDQVLEGDRACLTLLQIFFVVQRLYDERMKV